MTSPPVHVLGQNLDGRLDKSLRKIFFSFFFTFSTSIVNGRHGINGFSALGKGEIHVSNSDTMCSKVFPACLDLALTKTSGLHIFSLNMFPT